MNEICTGDGSNWNTNWYTGRSNNMFVIYHWSAFVSEVGEGMCGMCIFMNSASLKISLGLWNPRQCSGIRHSDLLGKAATLINGIKPERSHCLTVNVLLGFHPSSGSNTSSQQYSDSRYPDRIHKIPTFTEYSLSNAL